MHSKILSAALFALAALAPAYAQLPGIDAPAGAAANSPSPPTGSDARRSGDAVAPQRRVVEGGLGSLKNAIELCERLTGIEREICLQQARENRDRALAPPPVVGGTPGHGGSGAAQGAERAR